jgi:hypothetical protein
MMTTEYTATPADVSALYDYCWKHAAYFRRRIILNAVLFGLFLIAISFSIQGTIHKDDIAIALAAAIALPFLAPFIAKLRTKKERRTLSIDSKGLHTQIGARKGNVPWSRIANLFATEEHIFILGRNLNGFCIPRNAFRNDLERDEFIRLCRDHSAEGRLSPYAKFRDFLTPSTIFCVGLVLFLYTYSRPLGLLLYTKVQSRNAPEMWIVPTPLTTEVTKQLRGREFSYFGYEFESPWIEMLRERKMESSAILNFSNGDFISILDPARNEDELRAAQQAVAKQGADLKQLWGDDGTRSRFALYSAILNMTPRDLHLISSRKEMARNSMFLLMKSIWLGTTKGGLYSFETGLFRGFQIGSPARDRMTIIYAFDAKGTEMEMYIGSVQGANSRPTQVDINQILYSIRPASQP